MRTGFLCPAPKGAWKFSVLSANDCVFCKEVGDNALEVFSG